MRNRCRRTNGRLDGRPQNLIPPRGFFSDRCTISLASIYCVMARNLFVSRWEQGYDVVEFPWRLLSWRRRDVITYDVVEMTWRLQPMSVWLLYQHSTASVPRAPWRLLVAIATYRVWSPALRHTVAGVPLVAMATAASVNVCIREKEHKLS